MPELRPAQKLPPAKELTREVLGNNPLLGKLARRRLKELKAARLAEKSTELDFD